MPLIDDIRVDISDDSDAVPSGVSSHELLSTSHSDTTVGNPVINSIIYGDGSTWSRLPAGSEEDSLVIRGGAVTWGVATSAATGIGGPAGGDLGGTYPDPDVVAISGISVNHAGITSGQVLTYNGAQFVPSGIVIATEPLADTLDAGNTANQQIIWQSGLGGIQHLKGPGDQPFIVASASGESVEIFAGDVLRAVLSPTGTQLINTVDINTVRDGDGDGTLKAQNIWTTSINGGDGLGYITLASAVINLHRWTKIGDNTFLSLGAGSDTRIKWSTTQTNDALVWGLGNASNALHFVDITYENVDWQTANLSNPTILMHANDADISHFLGIFHNQSDAELWVGSGNLVLTTDGSGVGNAILQLGQVQPNGLTLGAPGLSFSNDPDSGFNANGNIIQMITNGTLRATLSSAGLNLQQDNLYLGGVTSSDVLLSNNNGVLDVFAGDGSNGTVNAGRVLIGNGSANEPALAFSSVDDGTGHGFYFNGTQTIYSDNATNRVAFGAGYAARILGAGGIQGIGIDANTALEFNAAGGQQPKMRWDSSATTDLFRASFGSPGIFYIEALANYLKDPDLTAETNPKVIIASALDPDVNNQAYLGLLHNQTDGEIHVGSGNLVITTDGSGVANATVNVGTLNATSDVTAVNDVTAGNDLVFGTNSSVIREFSITTALALNSAGGYINWNARSFNSVSGPVVLWSAPLTETTYFAIGEDAGIVDIGKTEGAADGHVRSGSGTFNVVDFNPSGIAPAHSEGRMYWSEDDNTLSLMTDVDGTVIQVGQEMVLKVVNKTGSTINNGEIVYINGAQGNRPTIQLAIATNEISADAVIGFATNDILNNEEGYITAFGLVRGIDTSSFPEGTQLWLSASISGVFTDTMPIAPNHSVSVGYVTTQHASNGVVFSKITNGNHLSNLHDVRIASVADGETLQYNAASGYWENAAGGGGASISISAITASGTTIAMSTSNDRNHYVNTGATGVVPIEIAQNDGTAIELVFTRTENFAFRIVPNAADRFIYSGGVMASGEYLELNGVGSSIKITTGHSDKLIVTSEVGSVVEETP